MDAKTWMRCAAAAVTLTAMLLVGCSDDDDNGGAGPGTTLTAQEQYDLIDRFLDIDTTNESTLDVFDLSGLELGLGMVHGQLFGGVTAEVFENFDIPGLRKVAPGGASAATVSFSYADGWWDFVIDSAVTDEVGIKTVHYEGRVRFETAAGVAQQVPDDNTARYIERADLLATVNITNVSNSANLVWDAESEAIIDFHANGSATLNSTQEGQMTVGGNNGPTDSYTFVLFVDGQIVNLGVPSLDGSCPSSGSVSVDLGLRYDATDGDEVDHVEADWSLTATISEGGAVSGTIQSGDFSETIIDDFECGGE